MYHDSLTYNIHITSAMEALNLDLHALTCIESVILSVALGLHESFKNGTTETAVGPKIWRGEGGGHFYLVDFLFLFFNLMG